MRCVVAGTGDLRKRPWRELRKQAISSVVLAVHPAWLQEPLHSLWIQVVFFLFGHVPNMFKSCPLTSPIIISFHCFLFTRIVTLLSYRCIFQGTSMLRGYVECARDLGKAKDLLQRMEKEKILASRPNVRTANTFLRGCLILGSVNDAEALLERMTTKWAEQEEWYTTHGGKPDASTYELVVSLLCQALRSASICRGILFFFLSKSSCARAKAQGEKGWNYLLLILNLLGEWLQSIHHVFTKAGQSHKSHQLRYTEARRIALKGIKELGASPGSAAMFASIARAAVICGNEEAVTLNVKRARKILDEEADFSEAKLSSCSIHLSNVFFRKLRVYNPTAKRNTAHLSCAFVLSLSSWISASKVWLEVVANVGLRNGTATRRTIPLQQIGKLPGRAVWKFFKTIDNVTGTLVRESFFWDLWSFFLNILSKVERLFAVTAVTLQCKISQESHGNQVKAIRAEDLWIARKYYWMSSFSSRFPNSLN